MYTKFNFIMGLLVTILCIVFGIVALVNGKIALGIFLMTYCLFFAYRYLKDSIDPFVKMYYNKDM